MRLPFVVAEILTRVAEAEACAIGVPMCIAITDSEGGLQLFTRMDGSLPVSNELSVSKAFTAAVLREATHRIGELAQPGGPLYGIQQSHQGRIILFGGGYPLYVDGEVMGGIGVSGGSVEDDMGVAQAAVQALANMESWAAKVKTMVPEKDLETRVLLRIKDELQRMFVQMTPALPEETVTGLTGGILLALA